MNKITLIGNVGTDPEIKQVGETKLANISLATTERYKDKSGQKVEDTTWHAVEFWGNLASIVESYVKKGDKVAIIGQQRNEKHEDKYYSKVRASELEMIGGAKQEQKPNKPDASKQDATVQYDGSGDLPF